MKNHQYLANTSLTDGYQGFYGLGWYGLAMVEVQSAFAQDGGGNGMDPGLLQKLQSFSHELTGIKDESDGLLADMKLDSINGQVKAAKYKADGFVEVLRFVGLDRRRNRRPAFPGHQKSAAYGCDFLVQRSAVSAAYKGNNIADRNLYERANDVCWWALTPLFRSLLAKNERQGLTEDERQSLTDNLQYINDLYTPYLRLVLTDTKGVVVAPVRSARGSR